MEDEKRNFNSSEDSGELTDIFTERERLDEETEARYELEHARREAEAKANRYAPSMRSRSSAESEAEKPKIEDFSDSQRYSMNRLNPDIQLTSVEEEYRRGAARRAAEARLRAEEAQAAQAAAQQAAQNAPRDRISLDFAEPSAPKRAPQTEPDDLTRAIPAGDDYTMYVATGAAAAAGAKAAGETGAPRPVDQPGAQARPQAQSGQPRPQAQPSQPRPQARPQNPQAPQSAAPKTAPASAKGAAAGAAVGAGAAAGAAGAAVGAAGAAGAKAAGAKAPTAAAKPAQPASKAPADAENTSYHGKYDYDYDNGESGYIFADEEHLETKEERAARLMKQEKDRKNRIVTLAVLIAIAVLLFIAILILVLPGSSKKPSGDSSSEISTVVKDIQNYTGVVTKIDAEKGQLVVYNAESGMEKTFTVKDKSLNAALAELKVGNIVEVSYDVAAGDALETVKLYNQAYTVNGITGIKVSEKRIVIDGKTYTIDDHLICRYNGESVDVSTIDENTVFSATLVGDHIYLIDITSGSGKLVLENLDDYEGGTLKITPASSEAMEKTIGKETKEFELPEGSVNVSIMLENKEVYSGTFFITSGETNTIRLPDIEAETGTVVFSSNAPNTVITIDGKDYTTGSGITFEYGNYTGTAKAKGYSDETVEFKVDKAYQTVTIEMTEAKAQITITANVDGYDVYVDGVFEAKASGKTVAIRAAEGTHTIQLIKEGYEVASKTVEVDKDLNNQSITMELVVANVKVTFECRTDGANNFNVSVGGLITQKADGNKCVVELKPGTYEVTIELEGYVTYKTTITVPDDPSAKNEHTFTMEKLPEEGTVTFNCNVSTATVTIDGKTYSVGSSATLEYGTYTATFAADGYVAQEVTFTVSSKTQTVSATLEKVAEESSSESSSEPVEESSSESSSEGTEESSTESTGTGE